MLVIPNELICWIDDKTKANNTHNCIIVSCCNMVVPAGMIVNGKTGFEVARYTVYDTLENETIDSNSSFLARKKEGGRVCLCSSINCHGGWREISFDFFDFLCHVDHDDSWILISKDVTSRPRFDSESKTGYRNALFRFVRLNQEPTVCRTRRSVASNRSNNIRSIATIQWCYLCVLLFAVTAHL